MTEDEAKQKWCPMVRHSEQGVGGSYNVPSQAGFNCIASGCMMWRWNADLQLEYRRKGEPAPEGEGWKIDQPKAVVLTYRRYVKNGYCGLGGE